MATEQKTVNISMLAAGDLSAKQYLAMKVSANQTVTTTTAVTDIAIGLLQNDPDAAGRPATVAVGGVAKGVLGATLSAGAIVAPMASGKLQAAVATQYPLGYILTGGVDGDIVDVLLISATVKA